MKISQKLALGFLSIVLLVVGIGSVCLHKLHTIAKPLEQDIPETIRVINESSRLDGLAQFIRYYDEVLTQSVRNFVFTKDKKWEKRYRDIEPKLDSIIREAIERGDKKDKEFFSNVDKANLALVDMEYKAIEFVKNGQVEKAVKILESHEYWNQKKLYEQSLHNYVQRKGARYNEALAVSTAKVELANNQTQNLIKRSTFLISIFVTIAILLSIGIGFFIFYSISNPIAKLKAAVAQLGAGKLDFQIELNSNDEIGSLVHSFNKMLSDLKRVTSSRDELNEEIAVRKDREDALFQVHLKMQEKIEQLSLSQKATLSMMEEIEQAKRGAEESTQRVEQALAETERMNKLMTGREMRVVEMKRQVNALLTELGREPQYGSVLEGQEKER